MSVASEIWNRACPRVATTENTSNSTRTMRLTTVGRRESEWGGGYFNDIFSYLIADREYTITGETSSERGMVSIIYGRLQQHKAFLHHSKKGLSS